jgi:predicted acyltransferase
MESNLLDLKSQIISGKRFLSIDIYKGIMISFAIFINATSYFQYSPAWNKGSELYGLTYVDLFGPFFLFALTMTFKASYSRRIEKFGKFKTYLHFIRRFSLYILIGFLITLQINEFGIMFRWGTLQMLGTTGLFLLLTVRIKLYFRILIATILLIIYQFIILESMLETIVASPHGGILGLLPWFSFATFASIFNEYFITSKNKLVFGLCGIILLVFGSLLSIFLGVSRQLVNLPFILICLGISILVYLFLFQIFEDLSNKYVWLKKERFFMVLGKNTLLLYILQSILKLVPYLILPYDTLPVIFFIFGALMLIMNFLLAFYLDKFHIFLII